MKNRYFKYESELQFILQMYGKSPFQLLRHVRQEIRDRRKEFVMVKDGLRKALYTVGTPLQTAWRDRVEAMERAKRYHARMMELREMLAWLKKLNVMAYVKMYNIDPGDKYLGLAWEKAEKSVIDSMRLVPDMARPIMIGALWKHGDEQYTECPEPEEN